MEMVWLSDSLRLIGVTNAGNVYLWNTSSCSLLKMREFIGETFKSVIDRTTANEIWVANFESRIFRLNYDLNDAGASFTVPTQRLVSLVTVP